MPRKPHGYPGLWPAYEFAIQHLTARVSFKDQETEYKVSDFCFLWRSEKLEQFRPAVSVIPQVPSGKIGIKGGVTSLRGGT